MHHKNHDHDFNPPDGSNWELLCIYCHDMEHQKYEMEAEDGRSIQSEQADASRINSPFAALADMMKKNE